MKLLEVEGREAWRTWLADHHDEEAEVWLVYFKKHTGRASLGYGESVEEALCFGWVDSLVKRLDEDRFARKFTPRVDPTRWSASNLARMAKLEAEGRMTAIGRAKLAEGVEALPAPSARSLEVPAFFNEALEASPEAARIFRQLAPSYRRDYLAWVGSAKRESTRQRRLAEAIATLERGGKLGMK